MHSGRSKAVKIWLGLNQNRWRLCDRNARRFWSRNQWWFWSEYTHVVTEPDHHQVLIRLAPASLNYGDLLIQQDIVSNRAGLIPLSEGAGIVAGVGSKVSRWK